MHKVLDSNNKLNELKEIDFYYIQGLAQNMVNKALEDEYFRTIYETKYQGKITKFSCELEFCLHELGLIISDPLNLGKDEVMFSNGERTYIVPSSMIQDGFDRHNIKRDDVGFPRLTDEAIKLDRTFADVSMIQDGIVDDDAYMSTSAMRNEEEFARIYVMHKLIKDKELYDYYINHLREYNSVLDFMIKKLGVASIKRSENGELLVDMMPGINANTGDIIEHIEGHNQIEDEIIGGRTI